MGGHRYLRNLLGPLPGARVQEADNGGYHALRRELDAGVRDPGGVAHSRTGVEAWILRPGRDGRCDSRRRVPVGAPHPGDSGK